MSVESNWIVIGRFGRPHGVKGFVTVHSFTEPRDNIIEYSDWYVRFNGNWQPIKVLSTEVHNKAIIAQIEGYPDRELVAKLTNADIGVCRDQLAPLDPGEYYWHQLIGMTVVNPKGETFGIIKEILPTGSNDVLVVQGEKRHLIPYLPGRFVIDVDVNQQKMTVDWEMDF